MKILIHFSNILEGLTLNYSSADRCYAPTPSPGFMMKTLGDCAGAPISIIQNVTSDKWQWATVDNPPVNFVSLVPSTDAYRPAAGPYHGLLIPGQASWFNIVYYHDAWTYPYVARVYCEPPTTIFEFFVHENTNYTWIDYTAGQPIPELATHVANSPHNIPLFLSRVADEVSTYSPHWWSYYEKGAVDSLFYRGIAASTPVTDMQLLAILN